MADLEQLISIHKKAILTVGQIKVIDKIPLSKFCAVDYILCLKGDSKSKVLRIFVRKKGTELTEQVFAKSGVIKVDANVKVSGTDFDLELENNEAFSIDVSFVRTLILE